MHREDLENRRNHMDFAGLSHRAFLQKSTPRGSQGKKSEHSFRFSQTAKTNESTTLILHGIPGVGESKKSRGDLANFRSAIRDFSSVCGTGQAVSSACKCQFNFVQKVENNFVQFSAFFRLAIKECALVLQPVRRPFDGYNG